VAGPGWSGTGAWISYARLGECGFAQLPNSGLIVSFCTAYFLGASGDPENGGPVEPDILVPDDDGGARAIEVAIQALRERNATPR
jgi:hypothetical protein